MNEDMTGFIPFGDGDIFKEITPEGYVEVVHDKKGWIVLFYVVKGKLVRRKHRSRKPHGI